MPPRSKTRMENKITLSVTDTDVGKRIDAFVSESSDITRSAAARLIEEDAITVSGRTVAKNYKLRVGDTVDVLVPEPAPAEAQPEDIPLDVVFEDGETCKSAKIITLNEPSSL